MSNLFCHSDPEHSGEGAHLMFSVMKLKIPPYVGMTNHHFMVDDTSYNLKLIIF